MFWRHHRYHDCYHHHTWLSFRRGMVAMFMLAFAVLGLLDYPHGHHVHRAEAHHSRSAIIHRARRHPVSRVDEHLARTHPKPTKVHNPSQRTRLANHHNSQEDGASTITADQNLTWTDFHHVRLPTSPTAGPHHTRGGLAWGFADTPRGALLAAVNIGVRTASDWGPAIFRPTIASQVTGTNTRALLAADIRAYAQTSRTSAGYPTQLTATEEAYQFRAYAPATATIDLVTSGPAANGNPVLVMTRLRVIWRHGDWRLVAPLAGNWAKASAEISSLAGYTIFPSAG